jgi:hypothetical protein
LSGSIVFRPVVKQNIMGGGGGGSGAKLFILRQPGSKEREEEAGNKLYLPRACPQ